MSISGRRVGLLLTAVCLLGLAILYVAAFAWGAGARLDTSIYDAFRSAPRGPGSDFLYQYLTLLDPPGYALLLLGLTAGSLVWRGGRVALTVFCAGIAANVGTLAIKHLFTNSASRPGVFFGDTTWPSGHMTAATILATLFVLVVPRRGRVVAGVLSGAWLISFGWVLMTMSWHRPSDVLAGMLVSGGCAGLVLAFTPLRAEDAAARGREHRTIAGWSAVAAAAAGLIAIAGAVVALAGADPVAKTVSYAATHGSVIAGALLIGGTATALVAVATVAPDRASRA